MTAISSVVLSGSGGLAPAVDLLQPGFRVGAQAHAWRPARLVE